MTEWISDEDMIRAYVMALWAEDWDCEEDDEYDRLGDRKK